MNKIEEYAKNWALELHVGQMYGVRPYSAHLEDVVNKLESIVVRGNSIFDDSIFAAAWLHDANEDCGVSIDEIMERTSVETADIVTLVSDPVAHNRKERKRLLYEQFRNSTNNMKPFAALIKCCDRWANHNESIQTKDVSKMSMYVREFPMFMAVFGLQGMASGLESLTVELIEQYGNMANITEVGKISRPKKWKLSDDRWEMVEN